MKFDLKYLVYLSELISVIVAFLYIKKWQTTLFRWFAFFLLFILIGECVGESLTRINTPISRSLNLVWYDNIVIPIEFLYYFWIFYTNYELPKEKRLPMACIIIYIIGLVTDIVVFHPYFKAMQLPFYTFSYTLGNVLLLVLILTYFNRMATSTTVLKLNENMLFWISSGLLVYFLGTCMYWGLHNVLVTRYRPFAQAYSNIELILDILMYLTFTFSIIWVKPNFSSS